MAQDGAGNREIRAALGESRRLFIACALFSVAVNLLMLTGPLFMLQIYDRVLGSRSQETLLTLTILVAFLFLLMGVLDHAAGGCWPVPARACRRGSTPACCARSWSARWCRPSARCRPPDCATWKRSSGSGPATAPSPSSTRRGRRCSCSCCSPSTGCSACWRCSRDACCWWSRSSTRRARGSCSGRPWTRRRSPSTSSSRSGPGERP